MPSLRELLVGVLLPGLISAAALLIAWRPWRGVSAPARASWGGALALGVGYLAAHGLLFGWPLGPPVERWQWLFHVAAAATVIGVMYAALPRAWWVVALVGIALTASVAWMLSPPPVFENPWTWRVAAGGAALLLWAALEPLALRRPGPILPIVLTLTLAAAILLILQSGFAKLAQLAGTLAATLGPAILIAFWARGFSLARGAIVVFAPLLVMMLTIAWLYMTAGESMSLRAASFILIGLAPAAAWVGEIGQLRQRAWLGAIVQVAVPCALLVLALIVAKPQA